MEIPANFKPRKYQLEFMEAMESGKRLGVICWARRAGKDITSFAYAVKKMVETPMNVVLVFPTKEQGREAFWDNIENDGYRTLDRIPKALRAGEDKSEMMIRLINGSTFRILGAKNPDKLRGANGKLYIFSEFVDIDSTAYDVVVPIIEVNGGQVIINSTPKIDGISGGTFKMMFDEAAKDPDEFSSLITAKEYLTDKALNRLQSKAIKKYGNDFFFRQEFLCDWGQASATSYYGQALRAMEKSKAIGNWPYNPEYPVYTAWDLGMSDSTAIVFFQYYDKVMRIIDTFETHDIGIEAIIKYITQKPYTYAWHFLPHDGAVRDINAIKRIEVIREAGLIDSSLLAREPVEDGIERTVSGMMKNTRVHEPMCTDAIRKWYLYKRKWNPLTGDYIGPEKSTANHISDALRYAWVAIEQEFDPNTGEFYMAKASQEQEAYDSDELVTTSFYSPLGYRS